MATYKVKPNQNLFDVALTLCGSIEGVFDLLISNPDLSMATDLKFGDELPYHEGFVLDDDVVQKITEDNIVPSTGETAISFKRPGKDLLIIIATNPELAYSGFKASGAGTIIVDWGDNSQLQYVELGALQTVDHSFDNVVDQRRIKIYGDPENVSFIHFDTTDIGGALTLCRPITVDEYVCKNHGYSLLGLTLLQGTYSLDLSGSTIADLLPIGNLELQSLNLRNVKFATEGVLDFYLEYIRWNYNDRRACKVYLTEEPTEIGYSVIDVILGEEEWNQYGSWEFYINDYLYKPGNG